MADVNKEAVEFWNSLKPMIDEEIKTQTRGMVQRRKMKVTTAPSLNTNKIGVTEPFGTEMLIPFTTNLISATVGDVVWVEFMYGLTNAFASMFASADEKDWDVAGNLSVIGNAGIGGNLGVSGATSLQNTTVNGVLDITTRRCYATLSSEGWYRVCKIASIGRGDYSFAIDLNICRQFYYANNEQHGIKLIANWDSYSFVNENSKSNTQVITKVRYTRDGNGNGYIDIYYDFSNANIVYCEFAAHGFYPERYTIESLQSVADSPSGETVLPEHEYTFAANTVNYSDTTTSGVRTIVDRNGKLVTVTVESAGGISCAQGQYTTVATLPSWAYPRGTVYPCVDAYGGNNIFAAQITTGGNVELYPVLSNTSYYRLTCTYVTT